VTRDYQRLTAQDASFLHFEHRATPMHVAALAVFEQGPLATAQGALDAERFAKYVESRLHLLPSHRRRLAFTPLERHPVWVDDERFDLSYHLRRTGLPPPGDARALRELVARILSQPLDRAKPLWELWLVEGLAGGRFAIVSKVHHCMVDGVSGANLLTLLFSPRPDEAEAAAPAWSPRPAPTPARLALDDALRGARRPLALAAWAGGALREPGRAWSELAGGAAALGQALVAGLRVASSTPLNRPTGPHRRADWHGADLAQVKEVKRRLGGTVNDVVLAAVAGALHRFLEERGTWLAKLDYRVVIPVNMRPPGEAVPAANRVSALFLSLPVAERDPLRRFAAIQAETRRLKDSRAAEGTDLLVRFADWSDSPWLTRFGVRFVSRLRPYHLIVTNVPGPRLPLYVLGAPLVELVPFLPLFDRQGLGLAVLSYRDRIAWGLVADREIVPDLARLARALDASLDELHGAALAC
jgi:WS/DGAT/MGAT family acyltransferase